MALLSVAAPGVHAQGAIDPERLIRQQEEESGSGRLTDASPDAEEVRARLEALGVTVAAVYTVYAQAEVEGPARVIDHNAGFAVRWQLADYAGEDATTLVAYAEDRHNYSGDGFRFAERLGSFSFDNPVPSLGYTRLRQFYLKQNLMADQLVLGAGKFSLRGLWNKSRYLGDKARGFSAFPFAFGEALTPPIDAVGASLRLQPSGVPVTLMAAVFDSDPPPGALSVDVDGPFAIAELMVSGSHWKPDLDEQPRTVARFTVYRQPAVPGSDRRQGVLLVLDHALTSSLGLGLRASLTDGAPDAVRFRAGAGVVLSGPLGRPRDQLGIAFGYARSGVGRDQGNGELYYRLNVVPGLEVTPDLQLLAGGVEARLGLRAVAGVRTNVVF